MPVLNKKPLYIFRTDGSVHLGSGHIMRCLALADALKQSGGEVQFICRARSGDLHNLVRKRGYKVVLLPPLPLGTQNIDLDASQTISCLQGSRPRWLIVDHYDLTKVWVDSVRVYTEKIMIIDDLAQNSFYCDALLNQNYGYTKSDYADKVPAECALFLGTQYALLRPEFANLRSQAIEKRKACQSTKQVLLSVGGMDPYNLIGRILDALSHIRDFNAEINIAISSQSPNVITIMEQIKNLPFSAKLMLDAENMAQLMLDADYAIGAAGSSSWERCCLALPSIILAVADNQDRVAQVLVDKKAARLIQTPAEISARIDWGDNYLIYAKNAAAICDGQGVNRVVNTFSSL